MASDVEVANRALQKLGAKRITSFSDGSPNASSCAVVLEPRKKALLRAYRWSFAIKRAELAADSPAPDWGRENAFSLPTDYLALIKDYPERERVDRDWQIEGKKILTNDAAPIYIRYIYNVTDYNEMDPSFLEALAADIAHELCEEITQSNTKKAALLQDKKDAIDEARRTSAIEKQIIPTPDDTWITRRA